MTSQPDRAPGPEAGPGGNATATDRGGGRGPFDPRVWRSPIRGPWLTSVFGLVLLIGIPVEFVTGLLSYAAYNPRLAPVNDPNPSHGLLGFFLFPWFTEPSWLFRLIEGIHVFLGLALVPVVLAKLWSVLPELFTWPPLRSVAHLLERLSLLMLVGGIVFQMTTGILEIEYWNVDGFDFYTGHYYGAWIFIAGFTLHVGLRFGRMRTALKSRSLRGELRTGLAQTEPEPLDEFGLVAIQPASPTISRRGVLGLVGGTSLVVLVLTVGETIGGAMRRLALFSTHYRTTSGPNGFPINNTAVSRGVTAKMAGPAWRLEVVGSRRQLFSRAELLALPQITVVLPIACTDGWSTTQTWTGVRLAELARRVDAVVGTAAGVHSLDGEAAALSWAQIEAPQSLVALKVNGADLSIDHGYPARIMVPAATGDHQLKWLRSVNFGEVEDL